MGKPLNIALWAAQILLAAAFGAFGFMKAFGDLTALTAMMRWIASVPAWLPRAIGALELLGAAGVILPALTRIRPALTPLAALGFAAIQLLAIAFHASRGETAHTIGLNLALLALAIFVAWGRGHRVRREARAA